jgi:D-inositol-3-phosphate glycosyltransferase
MKIVLTYNYVPTHLGGVEVIVDALATEYARRGNDVVVVGATVGGPSIGATSSAYRVAAAPALNWAEDRLGVPYPLPHPSLINLLRQELAQAGLVHCHGFLNLPTLTAFAFARLHGKRGPVRLLTEHVAHVDYPSRIINGVETAGIATLGRVCARLAEGIVVYNTRVAKELRQLAPSTEQRWIPNGVDTSRYAPPSPGERERLRAALGWDERPRVLFVGRLAAKKGADIAAQVAALGNGAFEVVMVGPGTLPTPNAPHVELLGTLLSTRVAQLYRAADAFLLPSYSEGFPLTAQEALASGLPVFLGEDESYTPYLEGAGQSIQLVPRDAQAITETLTALFQDKARAAATRQAAIRHASHLFSWQHAVDEHLSFADQLRAARD